MSASIPTYKSPRRINLERELAAYKLKVKMLTGQIERLKVYDRPSLTKLIKLVAIHTETPEYEIYGRARRRTIADVRCVFIWLAIEVYGHSKSAVSQFLYRDHSTIIFSLKSFPGKAYEKDFRIMAETVRHNVAIGLKRQPTSRKTILQQ